MTVSGFWSQKDHSQNFSSTTSQFDIPILKELFNNLSLKIITCKTQEKNTNLVGLL